MTMTLSLLMEIMLITECLMSPEKITTLGVN